QQQQRVPNTEVYLQGSVLKPFTEFLLTRLRGICDSPGDEFRDQESVFTCARHRLRLRWSLLHPHLPAYLRYLGIPESADHRVMSRAAYEVPVFPLDAARQLVEAMGFQHEFDFIAEGTVFRRGLLKVTVYRVRRLLGAESSLVEVSGLGPSSLTAGMVESVLSVRDQLKSLVLLAKHDQKAPKA
uniref:Mediator of RNA polymerase II transcription subunit 18 n=1 Tax=Macrostomum lignano TaxID=282301 RepID=A0A1I8F628_9PLAT